VQVRARTGRGIRSLKEGGIDAIYNSLCLAFILLVSCTYLTYLCTRTIYIYWCMLLITSSFTLEWAREAYVNNVYSMCLMFLYSEAYVDIPFFFNCFWFSTEKTCEIPHLRDEIRYIFEGIPRFRGEIQDV